MFIDPLPAVIQEYRRVIQHEGQLSAKLAELRALDATTTDDVRVGLGLNVGLLTDIDVAANLGVDEVGLYRSEFPFMSRETFPMEHEQYETYRKVLKAFAPKPVTMRTLDIGGDKPLSYFPTTEENPFLGWRGIRLTLDRPDIFLPQLRAMLRANVGLNNLRIMFPMIGQIEELKAARQAVDRARRELGEEGCECPAPPIGAMVEVPSALLSIPALSRYADFFSIGTNDLTQYLLAVDRNNPNVARLYNHLDPGVIRALYGVIRDARRCGKPVSVCGEMAADPGSAILLLGMGLETFSMSASAVLRIKWLIRSFSSQRAKRVLYRAMRMERADSVRSMLDDELAGPDWANSSWLETPADWPVSAVPGGRWRRQCTPRRRGAARWQRVADTAASCGRGIVPRLAEPRSPPPPMPPIAKSPARRIQRAPQSMETPLYLINLDAAAARRDHMLAQLQARGVAAHRIGIDCRTLSRRQIAARAERRFPAIRFDFESLSGAEIGCWMSHLEAWAAFLSSGPGNACAVIEDDVILDPAFACTIDTLAAQDSYDVVYLGTSSKSLSARRRASIDGVWVHEPLGAIYNTWGYVIRRDYLERLLAERPLRLAVPIDHILGGRSASLPHRIAVVQPAVVREEPRFGRQSQIEPYTWRCDRWRVVETARRAFLESRMSDWFYALVRAL